MFLVLTTVLVIEYTLGAVGFQWSTIGSPVSLYFRSLSSCSCTSLRASDLTAKVEKAAKVLIPLACSPI